MKSKDPQSEPSKIIHLDMYGPVFRQGYDACCCAHAIHAITAMNLEGSLMKDPLIIKIHKDNIPICQGLVSENMCVSEVRTESLSGLDKTTYSLGNNEVWLLIQSNRRFRE